MYILILFLFNICIIVILSSTKTPWTEDFLKHFKKYTLQKPMKMKNTGRSLSEINIDKYHAIDHPSINSLSIDGLDKEQEDE